MNEGSEIAPEGVDGYGDVVLVYDLVVDGGGQSGEVWHWRDDGWSHAQFVVGEDVWVVVDVCQSLLDGHQIFCKIRLSSR